jgi:hypothetical protein
VVFRDQGAGAGAVLESEQEWGNPVRSSAQLGRIWCASNRGTNQNFARDSRDPRSRRVTTGGST